MVSDELLLVMNPMNSTDIGSSSSLIPYRSDAERQPSGADPRGVVLGRMDPST